MLKVDVTISREPQPEHGCRVTDNKAIVRGGTFIPTCDCAFFTLTLLEPQSRFGDKPIKFQVVCPQNGTAVLKRLTVLSTRRHLAQPLSVPIRGVEQGTIVNITGGYS